VTEYVVLKGTGVSVEGEFYDDLEAIRRESPHSPSQVQLGRMVALCTTAQRQSQFRYYVIHDLGLKAHEVNVLVPCYSIPEIQKLANFAIICAKLKKAPYPGQPLGELAYH